MKEDGHAYWNAEDVPKIENFFGKVVQATTNMFEGEWDAPESRDLINPDGLLMKAFGVEVSSGKVSGIVAKGNGRVRTFMERHKLANLAEPTLGPYTTTAEV